MEQTQEKTLADKLRDGDPLSDDERRQAEQAAADKAERDKRAVPDELKPLPPEIARVADAELGRGSSANPARLPQEAIGETPGESAKMVAEEAEQRRAMRAAEKRDARADETDRARDRRPGPVVVDKDLSSDKSGARASATEPAPAKAPTVTAKPAKGATARKR